MHFRQRRMPAARTACILLTACLTTSVSAAVTIEGTEYPAGTPIDNEFAALGVLVSSELGYATFVTDDFTGIFGTRAGSTWAGIPGAWFGAPIHLTFVDPANPTFPALVHGTISARFGDGGGDRDSVRLRAFDLNDQLIGQVIGEAIDFGTISLTANGIRRVVFDQNPAGPLSTDTALDYVTFPTPVPVPEPSAMSLFLLGLVGGAAHRPFRTKNSLARRIKTPASVE